MAIAARFSSLSAGRQLAAVLTVVAILGAMLVAAWFLLLRPGYSVLFSDLRPADAALIVAELEKAKTPYELRDNGRTVLAPAATADATRLKLMSQNLSLKGTVGFELFNKSDLGLTDFAQKINYQRALQGELERTIMTLDAVDSTRVHLAIPESTLFREQAARPSASVTLRLKDGEKLAPVAVSGIQRLVAAAVPDLDPERVVVLDERGREERGMPNPTIVPDSPLLAQQRAVEDFYAGRVRAALMPLVAADRVAVTVELTGALDPDALTDWTPAVRRFGMAVTVALRTPVTADREVVRNATNAAIGVDPALGDTIVISDTVAVSSASPVEATEFAGDRPFQATSADDPSTPAASASLPWPLILVAMGAILLLGLIRANGRRPMNKAQRQDFAQRLRATLDREDDDGAARV